MIEIDKQLSIPAKGNNVKYPFKIMEIGESVFTTKNIVSFTSAAHSAGKRYGMKFMCRKWKNGTRIWRIK